MTNGEDGEEKRRITTKAGKETGSRAVKHGEARDIGRWELATRIDRKERFALDIFEIFGKNMGRYTTNT